MIVLTHDHKLNVKRLARKMTLTALPFLDEPSQDYALLHMVRICACLDNSVTLGEAEWHLEALEAHISSVAPDDCAEHLEEKLYAILDKGLEAIK